MANITRYNPFNEFVSLREAMQHLFEDSVIYPTSQWTGRAIGANLYETQEGFLLEIPMPGVKAEDVEITTQQDTLNLKWHTHFAAPEGATVLWNGYQAGEFHRSFTLPTPINPERVEAHYIDGILTLSLPKAEYAKARTVKVNAR
jgi:HSP20 family protein